MPGLIVDKVGGGNLNIEKSSNYQELNNLRLNNKLVPGQKYKLVNYLHKYLVDGTDTASLKETSPISKTPYNYYIYFESGEILNIGDIVTIKSLPDSYTGSKKVGDQGTVTARWSDGAHRISGIPIFVGIECEYEKDYYSNPSLNNVAIKERFISELTGTITTTAESATVVGEGTLFTEELKVEETFQFTTDDDGGGYEHKIKEIISDTELVVYPNYVDPDHVATNSPIEKITFGKDIMRPGGIINTEIHNGEDYSRLTAAKNPSVRYEDIILTAVSTSEFSSVAVSETYKGDTIHYDIEDTEITNRSGELIGKRDGFIYHRENKKLGISIPKNWREHRFRRFRMPDRLFDKLKFVKPVYKLDSGSQTYHVGGISNLSFKENRRYALTDVEKGFQLIDFNGKTYNDEKVYDDPFNGEHEFYPANNGDNVGPDGERWNHHYDPLIMDLIDRTDNIWSQFTRRSHFNLNFHEIECRDEFIIPLNENRELSTRITQVKVEDLENTIFLDLNKGQGVSDKIDVIAREIKNSTFITGGKIRSQNSRIERFTSYENFEITNTGDLFEVKNFADLALNNKGQISFTQFGGAWSYPINHVGMMNFVVTDSCMIKSSVIGFGTSSRVANTFDRTQCFDFLLKYYTIGNTIFSIRGALISLANTEDKGYGGNTWYQRSATQGVVFDIVGGFNKITGDAYHLDKLIRDKNIKTDPVTKELYYEKINGNNLEVVSLTQPKRQVNLNASIIADNLAPTVGDQIILTARAENIGKNTTATEVKTTIPIPSGYTYVSDDSEGSYDSSTGVWTIGNIDPQTSQEINITVTADATGEVTFTAIVSSSEGEIDPEDNTGSILINPINSV